MPALQHDGVIPEISYILAYPQSWFILYKLIVPSQILSEGIAVETCGTTDVVLSVAALLRYISTG